VKISVFLLCEVLYVYCANCCMFFVQIAGCLLCKLLYPVGSHLK
jgi:hypothetical protein